MSEDPYTPWISRLVLKFLHNHKYCILLGHRICYSLDTLRGLTQRRFLVNKSDVLLLVPQAYTQHLNSFMSLLLMRNMVSHILIVDAL